MRPVFNCFKCCYKPVEESRKSSYAELSPVSLTVSESRISADNDEHTDLLSSGCLPDRNNQLPTINVISPSSSGRDNSNCFVSSHNNDDHTNPSSNSDVLKCNFPLHSSTTLPNKPTSQKQQAHDFDYQRPCISYIPSDVHSEIEFHASKKDLSCNDVDSDVLNLVDKQIRLDLEECDTLEDNCLRIAQRTRYFLHQALDCNDEYFRYQIGCGRIEKDLAELEDALDMLQPADDCDDNQSILKLVRELRNLLAHCVEILAAVNPGSKWKPCTRCARHDVGEQPQLSNESRDYFARFQKMLVCGFSTKKWWPCRKCGLELLHELGKITIRANGTWPIDSSYALTDPGRRLLLI